MTCTEANRGGLRQGVARPPAGARRGRPAALFLLLALAAPALAAEPPPQRQAELRYLLRQDCGSCHGMTLKGGLGPALTPEALAQRDLAALEATILHGRPGTAMPPWSDFITPAEAAWLARQLKSGVDEE